jgi:heterodisulfide reductase subunit A
MFSADNKISMKNGKAPKSVTMVHCVGREETGFCSKICCNYMFKISNLIKEQGSDIKITHLIKHLSLPTKNSQNFYNEVVKKGSVFERYNSLSVNGTKIGFTDLTGTKQSVESDMVILAPAMIPAKGTPELSELLNIDLHETGFYQEVHTKKDPVSATTDGIFIIGTARTPGSIVDAIQQAKAATGKIFTQLIPGEKIVPEIMVSEVLEAYCTGCQTCLTVCEYDAIYFDEDKGISIVNEAVCRGCGNCVGSCPSGSIRTRHFTNPQLYQEVKEILR